MFRRTLESFRNRLLQGTPASVLQKQWANTIDQAIINSLNFQNVPNAAVLALGGYGRQEMSPFSDVDLLFLYEGSVEDVRPVVDKILYPLWDTKLEAGGATRTLNDCMMMFASDPRSQTAMLDARYVAGNSELANKLFDLIKEQSANKKWRRKFIDLKLMEHRRRLERFGGSVFVLEPNIKEGAGGIREYHTVLWIEKALGIADCELRTANLIQSAIRNPQSAIHFEEALEFLWRARIALHLRQRRRHDRLEFHLQKAIAKDLGYEVEKFMEAYYKHASIIHHVTSRLLSELEIHPFRNLCRFFKKRPEQLDLAETNWRRLFSTPRKLRDLLEEMHRTGNLARLIPEFSKIHFKVQHSAYHIYTIDVHSILTASEINELMWNKDYRRRFPTYFRALRAVGQKDLLVLAGLLHDIGKGAGSEHARNGAKIAREVGARLGLYGRELDTLSFLVGSHLLMPTLAFSRDIGDLNLIENFARSVQTSDTLNMLYVLSFADLRTIGPEVWTDWKNHLLTELYKRTLSYLVGGGWKDVGRLIEKCKNEIAQRFKGRWNENAELWLDSMPDRYFINGPDAIARHIELFLNMTAPIAIAHRPTKSLSELTFITHDAPGVFARITGALAANGVNIIDAELNTGGYVLDKLRVTDAEKKALTEEKVEGIRHDIERLFNGEEDVESLVKRKIKPSILARPPGVDVQSKIDIDNDVSASYTVIDVYTQDRIGLLYTITKTLFNEGCTIEMAKVLTKGDLAQDAFYVKGLNGLKIVSEEKLARIKRALYGSLAGQTN